MRVRAGAPCCEGRDDILYTVRQWGLLSSRMSNFFAQLSQKKRADVLTCSFHIGTLAPLWADMTSCSFFCPAIKASACVMSVRQAREAFLCMSVESHGDQLSTLLLERSTRRVVVGVPA